MSNDENVEESSAPLIEHLIELRQRLMYALIAIVILFLICFYFANEIFNILVIPYQQGAGSSDVRFIFTALQEKFFVDVRIAFFGALFLGFPVIATQIYKFVAPGLYKNEKGAFLPFLVATPVLFFAGACLVYFLIMPLATSFFLSLEQSGGEGRAEITNMQSVRAYLDLIMLLIFAFGLVFQLPVAITLLSKAGLVEADTLANKRKYAILAAFVAAALLTPPDPVSQLGLAIPTLILYEISILAARRIEKGRKAAHADDESDSSDVTTS
ncbi:MAG: twin-arginine translocase subunit TatC [Pseudomonadota bacterium]